MASSSSDDLRPTLPSFVFGLNAVRDDVVSTLFPFAGTDLGYGATSSGALCTGRGLFGIESALYHTGKCAVLSGLRYAMSATDVGYMWYYSATVSLRNVRY
eukprot:2328877-Rhodomonas_salina.1